MDLAPPAQRRRPGPRLTFPKEGAKEQEMMDFRTWMQRREELIREAEKARLARALRGSRKRRGQDEPERYMANLRAFLLGRQLPESPYQGHRMPKDYAGPR
jgi:hypothetical protein